MRIDPNLLDNANLAAFLRVIRAGESSQDPSAYWTMFGGKLANSLTDHPRQKNSAAGLTSTAAGAYQFLSKTWDECAKALDLPDFGPASQDLAAVFLIKRRGALEDVLAGRIETAIDKCGKEWASLPGSPYGQPTRTLEQALATYAAYGGALNISAEPVEKPAESEHVASEWDMNNPPPPPPEKPMAAPLIFLKAALPFLIESIPRLGRLFGSGSEVSERNLKAVEMAADTIKAAVGASTEQEAIERLRTDPTARAAADQAIAERWYELVEAGGGGIDGARKASLAYSMPDGPRFWLNPSFWISMILIAMPMMLLVDVLFVHPESYVGELRTQIVTGVLMVIGMVGGYWIGTSISSARKDERAA